MNVTPGLISMESVGVCRILAARSWHPISSQSPTGQGWERDERDLGRGSSFDPDNKLYWNLDRGRRPVFGKCAVLSMSFELLIITWISQIWRRWVVYFLFHEIWNAPQGYWELWQKLFFAKRVKRKIFLSVCLSVCLSHSLTLSSLSLSLSIYI